MRRLKIDLAELEEVFEISGAESRYYLDLQTGEVMGITPDMDYAAMQAFGNRKWGVGDYKILADLIRASDQPEEVKEDLLVLARVETDGIGRYLQVPPGKSDKGLADRRAFLATVGDEDLRAKLEGALKGAYPILRWHRALRHYGSERERWGAFESRRSRERVIEWLRANGIEPQDNAGPDAPGA